MTVLYHKESIKSWKYNNIEKSKWMLVISISILICLIALLGNPRAKLELFLPYMKRELFQWKLFTIREKWEPKLSTTKKWQTQVVYQSWESKPFTEPTYCSSNRKTSPSFLLPSIRGICRIQAFYRSNTQANYLKSHS